MIDLTREEISRPSRYYANVHQTGTYRRRARDGEVRGAEFNLIAIIRVN